MEVILNLQQQKEKIYSNGLTMKIIETIHIIDTPDAYEHQFTVDDNWNTAVTLKKIGRKWQFSTYAEFYHSKLFDTEKQAGDHLSACKNLAELFNLKGE